MRSVVRAPVYMQRSPTLEPPQLPPGSQVNTERPNYAAVSPRLGVCVYLCLCMEMVCSLALTPSTARERGKTVFFFPPPHLQLAFMAVLVGLVLVCSTSEPAKFGSVKKKKKKKILF